MAFSVNNAPLAIGANVTPLNTPLENQIGMVKLQQVKQLAIDQEKQRQTADAFQKALQTTSGDYDSAADLLDKQGYDTLGLRNSLADYRKKLDEHSKSALDQQKTEFDLMGQVVSGVHDQASQDNLKPWMAKLDPEFAKQVPPVYNEDYWTRLRGLGSDWKDRHAAAQESLKNAAEGLGTKAVANMLSSVDSDSDLQDGIKALRARGNGDINEALDRMVPPGTTLTPELVARARAATIDAKDQAAIEQRAATDERIATNQQAQNERITQSDAERERHDRAMEAHARAVEARLAAGGGAGPAAPNQPPSDAVLGYRDDIISGASKLTDVPAAGGMRNSVVAQLRKEGYDLNKPLTAQAQARVDLAKLVLPQVGEVRDMAKKIDAMGLMGTMGGRWRSLTAGESAADAIAGLTPAQRQLIGQFVAQADLLSSGTAMTHFGARAGGAAVDAMRQQLDPKNKSLDVYLGNLEAASNVLGGYAQGLPGATKHGETQAQTPAPTSATAGGTVRMRAPNGQMKDVPADRVDFYKSKGAVVVK